MVTRVSLLAGQLHYGPGILLHTATSGAIQHLDELYLMLESEEQLVGLGGIRINISYLTGIPSQVIKKQAVEWIGQVDWADSFETLIQKLHGSSNLCPPARALVDQTLHDARARALNVPVCALWGVQKTIRIETNQTLFWCGKKELIKNAKNYVERGFTNLKLRIGVGTFKQDLDRLELLRIRFGEKLGLSADVNGQWPDDKAEDRILALEQFNLAYLEQPVAASSWKTLSRLADQAPMTIMLDESVGTAADIDRIIAIGGRLAAHLKLVKCGGIQPLLQAGWRLANAGVPVMIGQMNEGGLATAAAAHCAMVLKSKNNELYGADGLIDDPTESPIYKSGKIHLPTGPGLGLAFNAGKLQILWEKTVLTKTLSKNCSLQPVM